MTNALQEPKEESEKDRLERIETVDLITFPKGIDGTNCGNCSYFGNKFCLHPSVQSSVTAKMCFNEWTHPGTTRQWE